MDFKSTIQRMLGITPTHLDTEDGEHKTPTSARKWTDAHVRALSQREIRRIRERDTQRTTKRFYKARAAEVRAQQRTMEANAVALLARWEKLHGRWSDDDEARAKVREFVGTPPSRGDQLIKARAVELAKSDPVNSDPHRVGVLLTDWAIEQAINELGDDADHLDDFDARKTFAATPAQVIEALGITEEDVAAEEEKRILATYEPLGYVDETAAAR